ncbi:hypothetical protein L7F22_057743 [Adiantum nelumboides]|nr:hypothetical protein [Adiantum nelumboides]
MPFGLTNAPATFQRFVTHVFQPFFGKSIRIFIDDFCIYSLRVLHLEKVNEDLARLQSLGGQLNVDKCHIAESQVTLLGHVVSSRGIEADPGKVQTLVGLPSPKRAKELVSFIQKVRYLSRFIHLLSQVVLPLQQLTHSNTFSWSEENEQQFNEIKELLSSLPTIAPPRWEETFYVNPSMGSDSIGAVLMQKDGESSFMRSIYFVSRVMTPLEKDYTVIEQMVMALMFAVGRFRSYLLPNKFVILTVEDTFPLVLQHMDVSARISKWLVRLQEFEYTVQVESSTQANLAGMLTHRCYERKVKVKAPRPKPVEVQAKLSGAHSLYFDGAYKRKVDKASVGISIQDENGQKLFGKGLLVENTHSNNEAEYAALTLGLEWCVSMGIKRLNVFGDALLLIKQVHGTWACRNQSLVPRLRRVIEAIQLYHVPRKGNQEADALASEQLQEVIVGAIKLQNPLFQGSDCMHDIVNFLETGECPQDMSKGQRQWLVCDRHLTYEPQTPILSYGPFEKWGIDAIGSLPRSNSGKLYIIMGVDYMTRWAEATTSARITTKEVAKFVYESICCKFGVPLEILSDRGPGFRNDLVGELMKKLGIEKRHSTPYYPQCNGLVEKVNGMIYKIITKQVVSKPKDWDKHLSTALWTYRTSFRTSLGYTPYHLVFGKEAILPIEMQLASLKILATKNEGTPSDRLKQRILDLERLELDQEMAVEHYATQAEQRRQKFNEGLKDKELNRGMLVLCYDNRFDTRKDKKFMSRWEGPYVIRKKYTNGSYRLQDISGKLHKTRVNGWRLKPYFQRFDAEVVIDLPLESSKEEEEGDKASSSQQLCEDEDLLEA